MKPRSICLAAVVVLPVVSASFHSVAAPPAGRIAGTQNSHARGSDFMQAKLPAVHDIVDGLAYEDFQRIEQGSNELLRLAGLASWKVRRDPVYMSYSSDFEQTALRLRDAARSRRLEEATFAYVHLTVSCTACHRHVRGVVQIAPGRGAMFERPGRVIR